jgi:D-alanine-D-alanine ligase
LARIARAAWDAFDLSGYARVDFRVAADGTPYVLEVNANPCLAPDAGFAAAAAESGLTYDDMIAGIVRAAMPAAQKAA